MAVSAISKTEQNNKKRPLAVTLFAFLHLLMGAAFTVILILTIVYSFVDNAALTEFIHGMGLKMYTPLTFAFVAAAFAGIALSSGIGMMMGKKWGWHIGAFYYTYNIFRNINFMFFIHIPIPIFPLEAFTSLINDPNLYIVKYAVRGLVFVFLYALMNAKVIRRYFDIHLENNLTIMMITFGILVILSSAVSGFVV